MQNIPVNLQPRIRRFFDAANSERFYPVQKNTMQNSSTSSNDSHERSKHLPLKLNWNFGVPKKLELFRFNTLQQYSASVSDRAYKCIKPKIILLKPENSYECLKTSESRINDKENPYASLIGNSPRTGESFYQRALQSGNTKRSKGNLFQLKIGNLVSPKIVKANENHRSKYTALNKKFHRRFKQIIDRNKINGKHHFYERISCLLSMRRKTAQPLLLGNTDRSKVNKEEVKRIFKLNQFKSRVTSDLFLDNYQKRISLPISDASSTSPGKDFSTSLFRSFTSKNFITDFNVKDIAGSPKARVTPLFISENSNNSVKRKNIKILKDCRISS